ncbi:preprotein translocase subunit Sec61beta [archaeon]|nr:preprotein translocase subunit Sec61beta [archaeon]MBT4352279.1 preprotein translocase subunit Sec61beta [archaeon]MBT4648474.1 preprotein translocase subunit Sec61beta [archaeon]MBT6821717.1 preprotein translocase subunit Sec61beta [archaeon]MBT7391380.1 preprotein translocase subunit Sec61beta [archaeon]
MARNNKVNMPSSGAGITRYYDDFKSKVQFQPGHIVFFIVIVLILEFILYNYGFKILGIN